MLHTQQRRILGSSPWPGQMDWWNRPAAGRTEKRRARSRHRTGRKIDFVSKATVGHKYVRVFALCNVTRTHSSALPVNNSSRIWSHVVRKSGCKRSRMYSYIFDFNWSTTCAKSGQGSYKKYTPSKPASGPQKTGEEFITKVLRTGKQSKLPYSSFWHVVRLMLVCSIVAAISALIVRPSG